MKQPHKLMGWMSIGQMRVYLLGTEYSSKSVQRQKCNPLPGSQWPHQRLRELFSTSHRFPTDRPQLVHGRVEPSSSSLQAKKKHTRGNWQHQGALCFFSPNVLLGFTAELQLAYTSSYSHLQPTHVGPPRARLHKHLNSDNQNALEANLSIVTT